MAVQAFSYATAAAGLAGYYDRLSNVARCSFHRNAVFMLLIRGTDAVLRCYGGGPAPYRVAIDGAEPTTPALTNNTITLFSGLTDTYHRVSIYIPEAYEGTANYIYATVDDLVTVTGDTPELTPLTMSFVTWPDFTGSCTQMTLAAPGGNYTPTHPQSRFSTTGSSNGAIKFRATCDTLEVFTSMDGVYYSVDGGTPVYVAGASVVTYRRLITLSTTLDGTAEHEYMIWDATVKNRPRLQAVIALLNGVQASILPVVGRKTILQLGDSITYGVGTTGGVRNGATDLYLVTNEADLVPANIGLAGQTTSQLTTAIPTYFGYTAVPDYLILAIGRNDLDSLTLEADYTACIQAALDAGCTKIVCRAILPEEGDIFADENADIKAAVDSFASSSIVYLDTDTWQPIELADGIHPTEVGHVQIAGYEDEPLLAILASFADTSPTIFDSSVWVSSVYATSVWGD